MQCSNGFWQYNDFEECHKQRFLQFLPLASVLALCAGYSLLCVAIAIVRGRPRVKESGHPPDSSDADAVVVVRTRSVGDRLRLAVELGCNVVHCALVSKLCASDEFRENYSLYSPYFPQLWTLLSVYTLGLACYRFALRNANYRLRGQPFAQLAYLYSALLLEYLLMLYSQSVHPVPELSGTLVPVLVLAAVMWLVLFSSPIGDAPAKLYTSNGSLPSTEPSSSLLRIMACQWCYEMIRNAEKQQRLDLSDVLDLVLEDHVFAYMRRLRSFKSPKLSFFWRTLFTLWRPTVLNVFFGCAASFLKLTPTIFIQRILQFLESKDVPKSVAWLDVFCLGFTYVLSDVASNQAFYQGRKLSVGVRALIMGSVYEKAMFQAVGATDASSGTVINLMSVDAFKIADFAAYLHDFFATPLIVLLSIIFLYNVIGWSAFVAVAAMVACLPLNVLLAKRLNDVQERLMAVTDQRIEKTNEVLNAIRIIKLYAWESRFTDAVLAIRKRELHLLLMRYVYWTSNCFVFFGMPIVVVISSFYCYVRVQGGTLTTSVAFTALAVFGIMRMPLNELAYVFTQLSSAIVSFRRIHSYLKSESTSKYEQLENEVDGEGNPVIGFEKADFRWSANASEDEDDFILRDINLKFKVDDLNIITGPTGAGKTSLLLALLGEMHKLNGRVFLPLGDRRTAAVDKRTHLANTVAYCPQEAWLMNGTVRQNILFSHAFDSTRYEQVVEACQLRRDFELFEQGDQTLIGDRGIALSGGQKQRVSLARALYSNSRHLLLDDCLSAVDAHTAEAIYNNALCGTIAANRTIVLVSHNVALAVTKAATVTVVQNGRVACHGTPAEVAARGFLGEDELVVKNAHGAHASRVASFANLRELATTKVEEAQPVPDAPEGHVETVLDVPDNAVAEEERAQGHVPIETYMRFISELTNIWGALLTLALIGLVAVFEYLENWWVRLWARSAQKLVAAFVFTLPEIDDDVLRNLRYYAFGYAVIGFLCICTAVAREMIVYYGGVCASRRIFERLLKTVVNARTRFFDSTPSGRIVNRFTKDMEIIDQEISANLLWFMISLVDMFQVTLIVSYVTPYLIPLALAIVYLFTLIAQAYLSAARELKRLESVTRSPIFQQFGETLSGSVLIRAYGDTTRFINTNWNAIDTTHRPYFWLWLSNRWLSFCCGMLSVGICVGAAALIVAGSNYIDAGMAGISLSFSTYFGDCVLWVVRMYAECEVSMNSVERVQEYMDIDQEAPGIVPEHRPPTNWPQNGAIEFDKLSLRYADDLPLVISNVSFRIPGGKKVGVVGRTGAGKSTIITALFRLLEPASGRILIDGLDISHLGLHDLRNALSIIPQEPTLFKGTIRSNLDLFDEHSDEEVFAALGEASLLPPGTTPELAAAELAASSANDNENSNMFFDLNHEVAEGGRNLSQGQRQLLCLARAVLKRPRILLLDEATASIDYDTDAVIQQSIRNTFKTSTILTIAHRLRTIADYDLILVLDHGSVAEFGSPRDLLGQRGLFYDLCAKSGELETLEKLAGVL